MGTQPELLGGDRTPEMDMMSVKSWFESNESSSWLLVIDNFDDLDVAIEKYIPKRNGAILFTTRNKRLMQKYNACGIKLEMMTNDEAVEAFFKLIGSDHQSHLAGEVEQLHRLLGNLPLAIAQAAAYIRETMASSDSLRYVLLKYLELFEDEMNQQELLSEPIETEVSETPDTDQTPSRAVMTTWEITLQHIQRISPSSIRLLQLMSFLDPDEIPRNLLQNSSHHELGDNMVFCNSMRHLQVYSLVTELKGERYRLHRLIGLWTRARIKATNARDVEITLRMSLHIISKNFPFGDYENLLECTNLMPHVSSVVKHVRQGGIAPLLDSYSPLHFNVGSHMYHRGNYGDALLWYRQALSGKELEQGSDHPDTLTSVHNIGLVFDKQGKYGDALEWFRRALSGQKRALGSDHPSTLMTVHSMASVFDSQGKYDDASSGVGERFPDRSGPWDWTTLPRWPLPTAWVWCSTNKESTTMPSSGIGKRFPGRSGPWDRTTLPR
jgi:tetratricopeptide (TPR) repeat protein